MEGKDRSEGRKFGLGPKGTGRKVKEPAFVPCLLLACCQLSGCHKMGWGVSWAEHFFSGSLEREESQTLADTFVKSIN